MIVMLSCLIISLAILTVTICYVPENTYNKYFIFFYVIDAAAYIMIFISLVYLLLPHLINRGYYG